MVRRFGPLSLKNEALLAPSTPPLLSAPFPLEPDRTTREHWLEAFSGFIQDHLDSVESQDPGGIQGAAGLAIAEAVSQTIPEAPLPGGPERLVALLEEAIPASYATTSPRYLAYVPSGALYGAAIADFVISGLNRFTGLAAEALAPCRLEADVVDWLLAEFGLGDVASARGVLLSGGSMANFAATVTARHAHLGDQGDYRAATAYVSTQTHHSAAKALRLAGIPLSGVRSIPVDSHFRMSPEALERAIEGDRDAGHAPFLVISSAGTTNTGAVDPLGAIADVCGRQGIWHHVDAAYGGGFVVCETGRNALSGIERADSITLDPHKSLFLPFGTGCLLVRDGDALRRAHQLDADYLAEGLDGESPSPAHYGPELSRRWRGLRLWLPLMLHGADAFRRTLGEKMALAQWFASRLSALMESGLPVEWVARPQLTTAAFRLSRRPQEPLEAWNQRNLAWVQRLHAHGGVFLSTTRLPVPDGLAVTLRICVLSFRVHQAHVRECLEALRETAEG